VGYFTMQDISVGAGMVRTGADSTIPKGTAKRLRVIALSYRAHGISLGMGNGTGPSGAFVPAITNPISAYGVHLSVNKFWVKRRFIPTAPLLL